ncbi:MAG: geranylgeranyl reductase family protein [Acidimicrobiia bacterium]
MHDRWDALVVGAGPCGASAAYWLAEEGHRVLVVEKSRFPREKTCGDGLTPRAVRQLADMGLDERLAAYHRFGGLRSIAHGLTLELAWPSHPEFPPYGYVVTRRNLDEMVAEGAVKAGAVLWQDTEAVAPLVEGGVVTGAVVKPKDGGPQAEVRARYVLVADGANSRFGRALGTARGRRYPLGMAIRGYYHSPRHGEPWIESHLDVRDRAGNVLPGYGWIFPVGDGTVNVGVGILSTFKHWKSINTSQLMDAFVHQAPPSWELGPDTRVCPPTGGKLPMGNSVSPSSGPGWLVAGDAAGAINPFNGEGIAYAYETGRMAAATLDAALRTGDSVVLAAWPDQLAAAYGPYFKVARAFVRAIGNPRVMAELTRVGMRSATLMEWVLRIMSNMCRPDETGPAEAAYKVVERLVAIGPEP